jgi:hypothetical protein
VAARKLETDQNNNAVAPALARLEVHGALVHAAVVDELRD